MGLFDTKDQQDEARRQTRDNFLGGIRRVIVRRLMANGVLSEIRPIDPAANPEQERARIQREEEEALQVADALLAGRTPMYRGRDITPSVPESTMAYIRRASTAADTMGEEAAQAVDANTGFTSGNFWRGLWQWIISGFGLTGGPTFMQCQTMACAPAIASDFRRRVGANAQLGEFVSQIPGGLDAIERGMNEGIQRAGNIPDAPPAAPPETIVGVQNELRASVRAGLLAKFSTEQMQQIFLRHAEPAGSTVSFTAAIDRATDAITTTLLANHREWQGKVEEARAASGDSARSTELQRALYTDILTRMETGLAHIQDIDLRRAMAKSAADRYMDEAFGATRQRFQIEPFEGAEQRLTSTVVTREFDRQFPTREQIEPQVRRNVARRLGQGAPEGVINQATASVMDNFNDEGARRVLREKLIELAQRPGFPQSLHGGGLTAQRQALTDELRRALTARQGEWWRGSTMLYMLGHESATIQALRDNMVQQVVDGVLPPPEEPGRRAPDPERPGPMDEVIIDGVPRAVPIPPSDPRHPSRRPGHPDYRPPPGPPLVLPPTTRASADAPRSDFVAFQSPESVPDFLGGFNSALSNNGGSMGPEAERLPPGTTPANPNNQPPSRRNPRDFNV